MNLTFEASLKGQSVLVTGHTGFTGGWLSLWLQEIGCNVTGVSLEPQTRPNLFSTADVKEGITSYIADIRDAAAMKDIIERTQPTVIFHLAAQPLVSRSYEDPLESLTVNVIGTANVLEAARHCKATLGVVCVTTDKVYADKSWIYGYRETDQLGGKDPYSASKACAEFVAACYRQTMTARANGMAISVARGGNIIGGGDWAADRIVPDFVRSVESGIPLVLRNPEAVRPWQHVLALVHGYLVLASGILARRSEVNSEFNFGPLSGEVQSVRNLVEAMAARWTRPEIHFGKGTFVETQLLQVDSAKSRRTLGWVPPIGFEDTVQMTAEWYNHFLRDPKEARVITLSQIKYYRSLIQRGQE